jgi:hypothetical protein
LFEFIDALVQPLNRYLTTELHRSPLSAGRLARFALKEHRGNAEKLKRSQAKAAARKQPSSDAAIRPVSLLK